MIMLYHITCIIVSLVDVKHRVVCIYIMLYHVAYTNINLNNFSISLVYEIGSLFSGCNLFQDRYSFLIVMEYYFGVIVRCNYPIPICSIPIHYGKQPCI